MMMLSIHSVAYTSTHSVAYAGTRFATNAHHQPTIVRAARVSMYVDDTPAEISSVQWLKSENGLSYKELEAGSGTMPDPTQTIAVAFKASYLSSGEVIEETAASRPLTFTLGSGSLPMFQEAVDGMAVGGTRRVMLPPTSMYSSLDEETVQFDVELVSVKTPPEAALFKVQQAVGNNRNLFRLALLSTFLPDILGLFDGSGTAPMSDAAFLGAPELAAAAAQHPVVLDAANRWAESTLSLLN
tara:strand:+ start:120 stop:845 length:726 start_codon:yes stop_codon:yes gene_type:complete